MSVFFMLAVSKLCRRYFIEFRSDFNLIKPKCQKLNKFFRSRVTFMLLKVKCYFILINNDEGRKASPNDFSFELHSPHFFVHPASKITDFGYTAIRQASPELGGAPIIMFDVGPGGIVNGTHQDLSYIQCSIYYSADMISHI